jgi:hypothetical protein
MRYRAELSFCWKAECRMMPLCYGDWWPDDAGMQIYFFFGWGGFEGDGELMG